MKRPFGITLIAILALLSGLFGLCLPGLTLIGSTFLGPLAAAGIFASLLLIVGPVLQFAFAYGAFKLRAWAWYLGLIASGIIIVGVIINRTNGGSFFAAMWAGFLPIIIFGYLLTPNARKAFGIGKAPQQTAAVTPPTQTPAPAQVEAPTAVESPAAVTPAVQAAPPAPVVPPPAAETPAADNTAK
jgi:hypothetical protein